jgi:zinc transport system permease protein
MLALDVIVLLFVGYYYHGLVSTSYDEEFALVRGVPVKFLYFFLVILIALLVVMVIRVVGLILVIALLTIPSYIAEKYADSLSAMMIYAVLLNIFFTMTGLMLSYHYNLTSGASIIMVAAVCFFLFFLFEYFRTRYRNRRNHG